MLEDVSGCGGPRDVGGTDDAEVAWSWGTGREGGGSEMEGFCRGSWLSGRMTMGNGEDNKNSYEWRDNCLCRHAGRLG